MIVCTHGNEKVNDAGNDEIDGADDLDGDDSSGHLSIS